jgi:hypothetical protein
VGLHVDLHESRCHAQIIGAANGADLTSPALSSRAFGPAPAYPVPAPPAPAAGRPRVRRSCLRAPSRSTSATSWGPPLVPATAFPSACSRGSAPGSSRRSSSTSQYPVPGRARFTGRLLGCHDRGWCSAGRPGPPGPRRGGCRAGAQAAGIGEEQHRRRRTSSAGSAVLVAPRGTTAPRGPRRIPWRTSAFAAHRRRRGAPRSGTRIISGPRAV